MWRHNYFQVGDVDGLASGDEDLDENEDVSDADENYTDDVTDSMVCFLGLLF